MGADKRRDQREAAARAHTDGSSQMKRILVVDDEEGMRSSIAQVLQSTDYEVSQAGNGIEALERITSDTPDLIVCDVHMPKLDGFGLLKELRKSERTSDIPFIFLTGQTERSSQREGMQLGADDYITKPFEAKDLVTAVELRLNKHQMVRDKIQKRLDELRRSMTLALPHEFRTPLTGILGFSEILQQTQGLSSEETVYIGSHIHKSATRLHKLVERMLLFTELETELASPERIKALRSSSAAVGVILGQVIESLGFETQRKEDVQTSLVDGRVRVLESHLSKVAEEILSNALKFSKKGTKVLVSTAVGSGRVIISVEDQGRGMSEEQIKSIGAFVQFDRNRNEQQGPGLGLALVKKICDIYDGVLTIDNSEPGVKTTINFPEAD